MSRPAGTFTVIGYEAAADVARRLVLTEIAFCVRPFSAHCSDKDLVEFKVPRKFWKFAVRHRRDVVAGQKLRKGDS